MRRALLLLALLALPLDADARARQNEEPPAVVEEGSRVRVTLLARKHESVVGRVLALPPGEIVFSADSTDTTVSRLDIKKLEVSRGQRSSAGQGAAIGAIAGGVFFALVGVGLSQMGEAQDGPSTSDPVGAGILGGTFGAVVVGGLGALIGSQFHHERWDEVKP